MTRLVIAIIGEEPSDDGVTKELWVEWWETGLTEVDARVWVGELIDKFNNRRRLEPQRKLIKTLYEVVK